MNNPNQPIQPSSLLDQKNQGRARVRVWVFTVISLHVFILMTLLIVQGCKREEPAPPVAETNAVPVFDATNAVPEDTNTSVTMPSTNNMAVPSFIESVPPVVSVTEYTIAKGDTLSSIAKKHGVSVKAIEVANPGVDPKKLMPGKKLNIPAAIATPATAVAPVTDSGETIHVVKSGDTLIQIAKHYGTTVKAIQAANNLSDTRIKVGEKLKIPVKASAAPVETAPTAPPVTAPTAPPAQ